MTTDAQAALFFMLGQSAERSLATLDNLAPSESLMISESYDLAQVLPASVKRATEAAESYRLFFVFENYLRDLVVDVLSKKKPAWNLVGPCADRRAR